MRFAACITGKSHVLALVGALFGLVCLFGGASAFADGESTFAGGGGSLTAAVGPLGSLVVPGAQWLDGGRQIRAQEAARRMNPEAVIARKRSRSLYAHLKSPQIEQLLRGTFPAVVSQRAGVVPDLPAGARIVGYPSAHAAQLVLPGKQPAIVESSQPLAKSKPGKRFSSIDLQLRATNAGYAPLNSGADVQIPNHISAGVHISGIGVSLTPVDEHARPLSGSGTSNGASVVYANTQPATDTLVKPTPTGFQIDAMLRSSGSPQHLYYRVDMPSGATLVKDGHTGAERVVLNGATLAVVLPPGAVDATGVSVPTSFSSSGEILEVSVPHRSGSYQYPIDVDPEINDGQLVATVGGKRPNWEFKTISEAKFAHKGEAGKEVLETSGIAEYKAADWAYWGYETKGNSKIYEIKAETEASNTGDKIESFLEFQEPGGTQESKEILSTELENPSYARKAATPLCGVNAGKQECLPVAGKAKNAVHFQQSVTSNGTKFGFRDSLYQGLLSISEPAGTHSTTSFNTTSPELTFEIEVGGKKVVEKRKNVMYSGGGWLTNSKGAIELIAKDPGIGVSATKTEYENTPGKWEQLFEHNYLEKENDCQGVQCYPEHKEFWTLDPKLPNGEDKIRYRAEEAMPETKSLEAEGQATVKVDTLGPHNVFLGGLPYGNELGEKPYELTGFATDGEGTTVASSGVKSIALFVNGHEIGTAGGSCSVAKGECSSSTKWTINGSELGAGHDAIVVVATDNAGNETRLEETISVRHSTPVALGPGSVDLESGNFSLGAKDVSLGSGLEVSRVYSSRNLTAGAEGSYGPQWGFSMGSQETLVELVDKSVLVTSANGGGTIFASLGEGKFESPVGDSNLVLTLEENAKKEKVAYYLKNPTAGTSIKFTLPSGSKAWVPTTQEGTVASDTVIYTYQTVEVEGKKITRPTEALAPVPTKVECSPTKKAGCRTLKFKYATSTTATGENQGQWGEYNGRLTKVSYEGYNPTTKTMVETAVAQYEYDKLGRLRAEWDPRISPALKTTYGYDVEGHVTAMTSPGQESWVFTYGTTATDVGTGRLLNAIQAPVSSGLWGGELPKNTEAPTITGTPVSGVTTMSVSNGTWSNSPVGYSYQWESCNTSGAECTPIAGATNSTYVPSAITGGHKLVAQVSAINGGGSTVAASAASAIVQFVGHEYNMPKGDRPSQIVLGSDNNLWFTSSQTDSIQKMSQTGSTIAEYRLPKPSEPYGIASSPTDKNLWFTERDESDFKSRIGKITTEGAITEYSLPLGSTPVGITAGPSPDTNMWFTEKLTSKIGKISTSGTITEYALPAGSEPTGITVGSDKNLWFTDSGTGKIGKITTAGTITEFTGTELGTSKPASIVSGSDGNLWVTQQGIGKIAKVTTAGVFTEYALPAGSKPNGIASGSDKNLWFTSVRTEKKDEIGKITTAGVITEYALATEVEPEGITPGAAENLWFAGTGTSTSTSAVGKVLTKFGTITTYNVAESGAQHLTAGPDGNVWFTDASSGRYGKITPAGTISEYPVPGFGPTEGALSGGITTGPDGNLWCGSVGGIDKVATSGVILAKYVVSEAGSARSITVGPDGNIWFIFFGSFGRTEIGKITPSGTISEYLLPETSDPTGITGGPDGNVWFTDYNRSKVEKITPTGTVTEYSLGAEKAPQGIVTGPDGNLWVAENGGVAKVTSGGTITQYPISGIGLASGITVGPGKNLWVLGSKIEEITTAGVANEYPNAGGAYGELIADTEGNLWFPRPTSSNVSEAVFNPPPAESTGQAGWTMEYGVPLEGTGAPTQMGVNKETGKPEPEKWGQKDDPVEATAIFPPDSPQGRPASNYTRASVYYLDERGRLVNTSAPSSATYGAIGTTEYNETNDVTRTLSPDNRATALAAGAKSVEVSRLLDMQSTYNGEGAHESEVPEPGTRLIETLGPQRTVKYVPNGTKEIKESLARDHTKYFYNEGAAEVEALTHEKYNLVTKTTQLAQLANEEEVEVRKTTTSYSGQSNLGWKLRAPTSVTTDPEGLKLVHTTLYNSTTGQVTETRGPEGTAGESAHDSRIIYYGSEANTEGFTGCGSHPEWAGLVCETLPAKQPETAGIPKLPVTTTTYNMWNEPETVSEVIGTTTRTTKNTYDAEGRLATGETTATSGTALPKVTDEYNSKTGLLEKQSTTVSEKTKTITSVYNTQGKLETYTDADGNVAKYKYGGPENDGLLEEMSDSSNESKSKQTYSYDPTTKALTKLTDSAAETFTASYDAEGNLSSEIYPNGMCANYTRNSVAETTHIEYIKTTNCSESSPPVWFSETVVPTVRGEAMSRTSTLASENYLYDTAGRLLETQETPAAEGCSTRVYAYDEEANRTSLTKRAPGTGGVCATTGGTVEKHTYDEANRLTDTGIAYDNLGNVTKLPAADAEGHELTSTFFVDNAVASQTQNGVTNTYTLDPTGRVRETVTGAKTVISHYDAAGAAVGWTSESAEKWTRNIPGIDGTLAAIQTNKETPVLQLHDLEGNIVATASLSKEATKLLTTYNSTEYGVPNAGKTPPKYAWLGAGGVASELASGVVTEGSTSYVPQTGRVLQGEQVTPPGLPGGSGSGAIYTSQEEPWNTQGAEREGSEAPGLEAARQREAEEAAIKAALGVAIDPVQDVLFSKSGAEATINEFRAAAKGAKIANAVEFLFTPIGSRLAAENALIGAAVGFFTADQIEYWYSKFTEALEYCVAELDENKHPGGTCFAEIDYFPIKQRIPNFFKLPSVSFCWGWKKWCHREYYVNGIQLPED